MTPIHHGEPDRSERCQEFSMRSLTLSWSKRFGLAGFLFFLCKGLLWLAVLAAAWRGHLEPGAAARIHDHAVHRIRSWPWHCASTMLELDASSSAQRIGPELVG